MKLTNSRYYFDFSATSPLASSVSQWLTRGDFSFANPSSIHSSGKSAKRAIESTRDYLYQLFHLDSKRHALFFHSGATEGINQIVKGMALEHINRSEKLNFFYAGVDHSCLVKQVDFLKNLGHAVHELKVDHEGDLLWDQAIETILNCSGPKLVNLTWVNNETGVVWSLDRMEELKEKTGAFVHVDAVQSIGKIENWQKLSSQIDAYTFSGHKFGALKGIGFSFLSHQLPFEPLIVGGGQQDGLRSGTQNTMGIESLKIALEELVSHQDITELRPARDLIKEQLKKILNKHGEIVGEAAEQSNASTLCFCLYQTRADILATAFDLASVDVSTGSACSSGTTNPSRVLLSMGRSEEQAKSVIRLSFSPYLKLTEAKEYSDLINSIVARFL